MRLAGLVYFIVDFETVPPSQIFMSHLIFSVQFSFLVLLQKSYEQVIDVEKF